MNNFFSNKRLIGILISVIAISALLALSVNNTGNVNAVQQTLNDVTSVFGRIVSAPVRGVYNTFESVDNLTSTYEENEHLKSKVGEIEELQARLDSLEAENQELEEELNLKNSLTDYEKNHVTVIGRSPDNWVDQLIVDHGSLDGIEVDMPVMSQDGLIGRVSEVNPTSSKVTLITTPDQRENLVSAEVVMNEDSDNEDENAEQENVVHGVIESYDEETNRLIMDQITSDAELEEGQQVVTSGLSGKTPRSLIIGTIDEVALGDFGLTQRVYVTPAADFNDIRYVTIIKQSAGNEE